MSLYDELMEMVIDDSKQEILNEVVVGSIGNFKVGIYGNGATDRGFANEPYFKFFEGNSPDRCKRLVRISMVSPKFIIHNGGEPPWNKFTKDDINKLMKILQSTPSQQPPYAIRDNFVCTTVWQVLVYRYRELLDQYGSKDIYNIDPLNMPNYFLLPTGKIEKLDDIEDKMKGNKK